MMRPEIEKAAIELVKALGYEDLSTYREQADFLAPRLVKIIAQERAEVVAEIASRLDSDPHQWSKRPCATCDAISRFAGRDFGCVSYAKSPLNYTDYGRAAASRKETEGE